MSEEIIYENVNNALKKTIPQPDNVTFESKAQLLVRKQNYLNQIALLEANIEAVDADLAKCEELNIKTPQELGGGN